jgi:hypothetical protein
MNVGSRKLKVEGAFADVAVQFLTDVEGNVPVHYPTGNAVLLRGHKVEFAR